MKKFLFLLFVAIGMHVQSQVSINNDSSLPDNSAMLDVKSTNKGILLPRMTLAQRNGISSPANGLTIFQTDNTPGIYNNTGTSGSPLWVMAGNGSFWRTTGNAGTTVGTNFLGTTDAQPLKFKVNNQNAGYIDFDFGNTSFGYQSLNSNSGSHNSTFGYQALYSNTTGNDNTASGANALYFNTTGIENTATGYQTLYSNTTGNFNSATGSNALSSNTTGSRNTANGYQTLISNITGSWNTGTGNGALASNTTGDNNTATGGGALASNTTGINNTATGANALYSNTTGYSNTANGFEALYTNTTGGFNTANGLQALRSNITGYYNTAIGQEALHDNIDNNNTAVGFQASLTNTTGYQNTSLGAQSLVNNTSGSYNTAIGYNTGPNSTNYSNTTCLGIDAAATGSNMVRIGNIYVGSIGGYQNWTSYSDGRFKENVKEDVPGLSFITQLRPVTYQLNRDKINEFTGVTSRQGNLSERDPSLKFQTGEKYSQVTTGFIAQEVEAAAKHIGFDFNGVDAPDNENDMYGLRYAEFVVPLVKGMQEQQQQIEELKSENKELKSENAAFEARLIAIKSKLSGSK